MSDSIKGFVITLDKDYKNESADYIKNALSAIKGVADVTELVKDPSDYVTEHKIRYDLATKLIDFSHKLLTNE